MPEKEIFANYELDNSKWNNIILKLLGGSLVLHLIIFLSAVYIPVVRDAFYVASLFSDAPSEWAKGAYVKTELEEAEIISFNTPPTDQLQYPSGYFELANGNALPPTVTELTTQPAPEIVSLDNGLPTEGFPPVNPITPIPLPTPDLSFSAVNPTTSFPSVNPPLKRKRRGAAAKNDVLGALPIPDPNSKGVEPLTAKAEPSATPNQTELATAQPSPSPSGSPADENKLKQQPWIDVGAKAVRLINEKKLDLKQTVDITITGEMDKDGKFVGKPKIIPNANGGDPVLRELAGDFVLALNDSGMLKYIKDLNDGSTKRTVSFHIVKDQKQIAVQLVSAVGDEARARKIANSLNLGFVILKAAKQGSEEGELLDKVQLTNDKGQVVISWMMPADEAMTKIQKKLDQLPQLQQQTGQQPVSNAQVTVK